MITAWIAGFLLGASLIIAIGSQNAFVLRQGLRGEHVALICLTCAVSDALLIGAGVAGFGVLVERNPWVGSAARYGGAAFLLIYALLAFVSAWRGEATLQAAVCAVSSWKVALGTCLALTWLNPHVYLDTLVLLGAASLTYEESHLAFGSGAVCASFLFFFSLGYGARLLQPVFARPVAWRILDMLIGLVMLTIALGLLR